MKKAVNWAMYTGSIGFMLNGIIGIVKLLHGNNKVAMQAHLAVVFFVIAAVGIICKILLNRCPNCRKSVMTRGEYCPYCGEKIKKSNELLDGTVLRHEWFKSRKSPISPADGKNEAGEKVRFHKKAVNWVQAIALVAFVVDLCFIAGEWLQSDCERLTAGCIGAACWFIVLICVFCTAARTAGRLSRHAATIVRTAAKKSNCENCPSKRANFCRKDRPSQAILSVLSS